MDNINTCANCKLSKEIPNESLYNCTLFNTIFKDKLKIYDNINKLLEYSKDKKYKGSMFLYKSEITNGEIILAVSKDSKCSKWIR